jgi:hypothetical protein
MEITMKKLLVLSTILSTVVSNFSFAQAHGPSTFGGPTNPLQSMCDSGICIVPIYIKNIDSHDPQIYDIEVNGKIVGTSAPIKYGSLQYFNVPVKTRGFGEPERHKICSISKTGITKFRICTMAYLVGYNK